MRAVVSIFVLVSLMLQSLFQLGLIAYYKFNVEEIEAKYCINKDRPDSCCKGQCYISKELDKSNHQLPARSGFEERDIPFFILPVAQLNKIERLEINCNDYFQKHSLLSGFETSMFHPPEIAV